MARYANFDEDIMKQYRPRDRYFLRLAWLAGTGGFFTIAFSIGIPIESMLHHRPYTPSFFFFGVWGIAALCGCAACISTYFTSGSPPGDRPPPGGLRERTFSLIEGGAKTEGSTEQTKRAA
jgi:hypothetical protein